MITVSTGWLAATGGRLHWVEQRITCLPPFRSELQNITVKTQNTDAQIRALTRQKYGHERARCILQSENKFKNRMFTWSPHEHSMHFLADFFSFSTFSRDLIDLLEIIYIIYLVENKGMGPVKRRSAVSAKHKQWKLLLICLTSNLLLPEWDMLGYGVTLATMFYFHNTGGNNIAKREISIRWNKNFWFFADTVEKDDLPRSRNVSCS